ncbi:MAG: 16S rRNA (guanine(966)-N(2))-methyltransferase RsmD [Phycisphaerales bacterium]|nr:16S rRNA (guanine(966)-N(2))-methyltransferase RsmD [Phycisphaerales bacterium]
MLSRMLQIISGNYRSRRLQTPADSSTTRPYAHRVKESVFNILRGRIEGGQILDLFAGVGTMGLEAASRGASRVLMVEQDRGIYQLLKSNVEELGCGDEVETLCGDALGSVSILRSPRPLNVVFVDPPFRMMQEEATRLRVLAQVERVAPLLADDGFIVVRSPGGTGPDELRVPGLVGPEVRNYGSNHQVLLYGLHAEEEIGDEA